MKDDMNDMLGDDLEKFQSMSGQGMDTTIPALIELGFAICLALVALAWFAALLWTPDPIGGTTWMGLGVLGGILFGVPLGLIYALRRGGKELIGRTIRGYVR